jgi:hypothetical protein
MNPNLEVLTFVFLYAVYCANKLYHRIVLYRFAHDSKKSLHITNK